MRQAKRHGGVLRQSHTRLAKVAAVRAGRYAHARQFCRMRRKLMKLRTYLGRLFRDINHAASAKREGTAAAASRRHRGSGRFRLGQDLVFYCAAQRRNRSRLPWPRLDPVHQPAQPACAGNAVMIGQEAPQETAPGRSGGLAFRRDNGVWSFF